MGKKSHITLGCELNWRTNMYANVMYQGKLLVDWQKELNFEFSLGELYRMVKDGCDLGVLLLRTNGHITFED